MVTELMVLEISLKNGVSLSQSNPREINCISCSACENEMHTDLSFEVQRVQVALEFHHIIEGKKSGRRS